VASYEGNLCGIGDRRKVFWSLFDEARFAHDDWRFSELGELPVCPRSPVVIAIPLTHHSARARVAQSHLFRVHLATSAGRHSPIESEAKNCPPFAQDKITKGSPPGAVSAC
jgi:hypothetical protein